MSAAWRLLSVSERLLSPMTAWNFCANDIDLMFGPNCGRKVLADVFLSRLLFAIQMPTALRPSLTSCSVLGWGSDVVGVGLLLGVLGAEA